MSGATTNVISRHGDVGIDPFVDAGSRYVVGVNGSAAGAGALDWVLDRAGADSRIHLVAVAGSAETESPEILAAALRRSTESADRGRLMTSELRHGAVPLALASAAGEGDLIVVGSDKTGFARGRLYGLRAVQLAAAVEGSLAIVPSVDLRLRRGVVVAVADLAGADRLARVGAREALRRGCALSLVHVESPTGGDSTRANAILTIARGAARAECPDIDVWARVVHRRPAEAILNLSRDKAMLVVGRSRHESALGVGETLHEILLNTNAPTVVVA